jgi:hypothetical protein
MADKLYTARDISDILHCSPQIIGVYRARKVVKGHKIRGRWFYTKAEVDEIVRVYEENQKRGYDVRGHKKGRPGSICWGCAKACAGCSWSKNLTPVPGWEAVESDAKYKSFDKSYIVLSCPEYEPDKRGG